MEEELGSDLILTELTPDEAKLIDELRTFQYGKVVIFKDHNQCVRVEEVRVSKKL